MATQIILLERVEKLGEMGDVVSVKPGYARNFLFPQKKAMRASKDNVAYFEAQKKVLAGENEKKRKEAEKQAKTLADVKVAVIRQASEAGQLYGSVTSRDIAEALSADTKQAINKSMVVLNQAFKIIGLFPVDIALHPEVKVSVTLNIARSPEEALIQAETGRALIAGAQDDVEEETAEETIEDIEAEVEAQLEDVLEADALEAEKEKQVSAKEKEAEEAAKAEAREEARAEKKAAEDAAAAEAAAEAEEAGESAEGAEEAPEAETAE